MLYYTLILLWFILFMTANGLWSGKAFTYIDLIFFIFELIAMLCMVYLKYNQNSVNRCKNNILCYDTELFLLFITLFEFINYMFHDSIQIFIDNLNLS